MNETNTKFDSHNSRLNEAEKNIGVLKRGYKAFEDINKKVAFDGRPSACDIKGTRPETIPFLVFNTHEAKIPLT